jgi:hypothetical protein
VLDDLAQRHLCMFGTADAYCAAPASVHVLQLGDHPTMSCDDHKSWWGTHRHQDAHPVMATCGMPGTTWMYAMLSLSGFTPGYCAVEGLNRPPLVEFAEGAA